MRALVLLGGQGTRLRPLTYAVPKPMLPIAGRPMVARTIEWLARHEVDEVVFSLGYLPDAFQEAFPDEHWAGVRLRYAVEPNPLDTAGAIRFAARAVGASGERLVVVNGDVLTDLDLSALVTYHERCGGEGTIHLTPVLDPSEFGVVPTDRAGRVLAFIEKPPAGEAPTNLVNAGTYILEPAALARIPAERPSSIEREVFPAMVADGVLFALGDESYWIDTGTVANYLRAQLDVLDGRRPDIELSGGDVIVAGAHLGEGSVLDGEVLGTVLAGRDVRVASGAVLERCVLGDGVEVGPGATVRRSVLLDGAHVERDATIEDSVVGGNAVIGTGAVISGLSLIGFNEHVQPGSTLDNARQPA